MKLVIVFLFLGAVAKGQNAPQSARIQSVKIHGSGCEKTTGQAAFSPDLMDLSILFNNYSIEIGEGSKNPKAMKQQKNCLIHIDIVAPAGWQYAFKSVDYRGYVNLPVGATGFHRFNTMSGSKIIPSLREVVHTGAINEDYTFHVETLPERRVWSNCISGNHQIKLQSQLGISFSQHSGERTYSTINLDTQDFSLRQSFGVEWRRCQ